jgi:hypothetical protein
MAMRMRWLLIVLTAVFLLGACSRAELVYENADWLLYRWAIKLVDASPEQREAWRGRFDELLRRHREELLPDVVALLEQLEADAERGLSVERLECLIDRADSLYMAHARLALPLAVDILMALSPAQVDHLAGQLAERNRDYADDYLDEDPQRRVKERTGRYIERVERWTGALDRDQRTILEDAIQVMPETAGAWFDYRRSKQQRMLRLLRANPDEAELTAFLTAWWVEFEGQAEGLSENVQEVQRRSIALAVAIDDMLSQAQRGRFAEKVADLRSDLESVTVAATAPVSITVPRCG